MTDKSEQVAALEMKLEHASAIAACSIGQPDRAANVAYREELRERLRVLRIGGCNRTSEPMTGRVSGRM